MKSMIIAVYSFLFSLTAIANEPQPHEKILYKDVKGIKLNLHVYYPDDHKKTDKRPVIVFFHGGGWVRGAPVTFYRQCNYLASRGMVAISAEYRLKSTHKTTPIECVKDAKSAIRWVRKNADKLGIDPDKLIAGGGSAGGHIAAATGTATSFEEDTDDKSISYRPQALVLFNPVYDNSNKGFAYNRVKKYWKEISPMHNLTKDTPPTIVMLGTKDKLIPVATAKKYKSNMEALGIRSDLYLYEGQQHAFFNYSISPEMHQKTTKDMDHFLSSLGYIKALDH